MMAQAMRINILTIKLTTFCGGNYRKMFSQFLLSLRNTHKSLGGLVKPVETLTYQLIFPQLFLFSQTFTYVSITKLDDELQKRSISTCFSTED